MINNLTVRCPLNGLSFGNVSYNILRELYKLDTRISLLPVGNKADLSAFDSIDQGFAEWIKTSLEDRYKTIKREDPFINLWHVTGSDSKIGDKNVLYSFYEGSQPTEEEVNLVKLYDSVVFSSKYARDSFRSAGADNACAVPLGFDEDFRILDKEYLKGKVHFGLMGKWEKRKHTSKIIQTWAKTYGNNYDFQLSCCVNNDFLSQKQIAASKSEALMGESYGNINFLPRLPKNSQVNDFLNSIDIDLGGMSGAEGWNLPSFNATCLGKWSIVLNATSHKDWAKEDNCILVEPSGEESLHDGIFFIKGSEFNQGVRYAFAEEDLIKAMDTGVKLASEKKINSKGIELREKFSYKNTVKGILDKIIEIS